MSTNEKLLEQEHENKENNMSENENIEVVENPNEIVDSIIDELGMHKYNIIMFFLITFTFLFDAIDSFIVVLLLPVLKEKYGLTDMQNSLIVILQVWSIGVGNFCFGFIIHKFGEKKPFLLSFLVIIIANSLSVAYDNVIYFTVMRGIVGFAVGINYNYGNSLFEILPSKYRGFFTILSNAGYEIGIISFAYAFYYYTLYQPEIEVYKMIVILFSIIKFFPSFLEQYTFRKVQEDLSGIKTLNIFLKMLICTLIKRTTLVKKENRN